MPDHRALHVWQRAHALSVRVYRITEPLSTRTTAAHYVSQFRRAVSSIPSNIAEGRGQATAAQFARYLSVAIGSASEAMNHCAEMGAVGLIDGSDAEDILSELQEIRAMMLALRARLRPRSRKP